MSDSVYIVKDQVPSIYTDITEIKALVESEQALIDDFTFQIQSGFDNTFVLRADDLGLKSFEDMLGIKASIDDSIEFRRFRVINRMALKPPLTFRWLNRLLENSLGAGKYKLELDTDTFTLRVILVSETQQWYDELYYTILHSIPANIVLELAINIYNEIDNNIYPVGVVGVHKLFKVNQEDENG